MFAYIIEQNTSYVIADTFYYKIDITFQGFIIIKALNNFSLITKIIRKSRFISFIDIPILVKEYASFDVPCHRKHSKDRRGRTLKENSEDKNDTSSQTRPNLRTSIMINVGDLFRIDPKGSEKLD